MRFAFKTAPQHTMWDSMLAVWREADDVDLFESGWTFDHFYPIYSDSTGPCLEGWATLTALAQATRRLRLGTLVTGIHYRHPAVLANMAATLDIISGGRLEVGIGAGWDEEESGAYGIPLGSPKERSDRFEEACAVMVRLLSSEESVTFEGKVHCADIGRDPQEILLSSHVRFDGDPAATAAVAAALAEAGAGLAIVQLRPPHTPEVLVPLAEALAAVR